MILHLAPKKEWESAPLNKPFIPAAFARDGFVHCTKGLDALVKVANAFYRDAAGEFVALEIDETKLTSELRWEAPAPPAPVAPPVPAVVADTVTLPPEVSAEYGEVPTASVPTPEPPPSPPAEPAPAVASEPEQTFPHVYGPINREAIVGIRIAARTKAGEFVGFTQSFKPDDRTPTMRAADDLLKATDDFAESLSRYKDRIKSQIDDLDEKISKGLP